LESETHQTLYPFINGLPDVCKQGYHIGTL